MDPSREPFPPQLSPCPPELLAQGLPLIVYASLQPPHFKRAYMGNGTVGLAFFLQHDSLEIHPCWANAKHTRFL